MIYLLNEGQLSFSLKKIEEIQSSSRKCSSAGKLHKNKDEGP